MTLHFGNFPEYLTYSGAQENCQNAGSFGKKWLWNGLDCGVVCSEKNNYFFGVSLKKNHGVCVSKYIFGPQFPKL